MKVTPTKIIEQLLKKKIFNPQQFFNKKFFFIGVALIFLTLFLVYFLKPFYFDYNTKKDIIQKKISDQFKLKTQINGNISYSAIPIPTIIIENIKLNLAKDSSDTVEVKKVLIRTSINKISSINQLEFKKIIFENQNIKISPSHLRQIFTFFTYHKKGQVIFKNSKVIFRDNQKNIINFDNINLNDKFKNDKHVINAKINFSNNDVKINFENLIDSEKSLKIKIPSLKQNLEINFDKQSTLKKLSGDLKLNIFNSILLLNFKGKDSFEISNSYLRSKYLNSKINGKISFKDPFNFNVNLDINQINFRKLFKNNENIKNQKISKKINGTMNVKIKSLDTLFGKLKDTKMKLNFQNGDLKISGITANLPFESTFNSNLRILLNNKKPIIEYKVNFSSANAKKFLRKLSIYDFSQKKASWYSEGVIDIKNRKINIKKLLKDQVRITNKNQIKLLEDSFNKNVIDDEIIGIFDTFKFKKFLKEIY